MTTSTLLNYNTAKVFKGNTWPGRKVIEINLGRNKTQCEGIEKVKEN